MADTPSSILLLRLQATGENTNLWGGYLNTALQTLERSSAGYQSLAVTGDATISWTNYSASNSGAVKTLKLTGTLTADATLTLPTYHNFLLVWNAAGDDVTIKCSGGTGIQIPNNRKALLFCDGTDYYSASPSYMPDNITEANDRDYMDKAAVSAAITALVGATTAGLVLISAADTTSGYLNGKLAAGSGISLTDSGAGNSTLTAALNINGLTAETSAADADAIAVYDASAGATAR